MIDTTRETGDFWKRDYSLFCGKKIFMNMYAFASTRKGTIENDCVLNSTSASQSLCRPAPNVYHFHSLIMPFIVRRG